MKNKLSIIPCRPLLGEEAARAGAEVFVVRTAGVGSDGLESGSGRVLEVALPANPSLSRHLAAYGKWMASILIQPEAPHHRPASGTLCKTC
jgi:hypothetical protein